ncbi:MAG: acyl-CoA dehydrogenase family protein [Syntrophorhabdales bacterium]|jgi:acyl-CoA dehydrogenase
MEYCNLDLNLTKEDRTLRDSAHKFAETVMRPISIELDKMSVDDAFAPQSPFWDFMRKAYKLGYHKLPFPEVVGGPGLTPWQIALVMEELAWGSFGLTLTLNTSLDAAVAVEGGEEFIKTFTVPYCQDTEASYIGCWAITEPDHGSDTVMPGYPSFRDPNIKAQCRARLDGDEYVIFGQKAAWVSGGPMAKTILLMCQVEPSMGHAGSGIFVFSLDRPGVSKGKPLNKIGTRDLCQGEVYFHEVRVPKESMIIGPDRYEGALAAHLCMTTPMVGVWATGLARAAFEETLNYARQREQGGKLLIDHPNIQQRLFDMFRKVEASRQLCRSAFVYNWTSPPEKRVPEYAFAAKTFATQTAVDVTGDAIQTFGGNGISKEYLIEKLYRDARTTTICDGSNDSLSLVGGFTVAKTYPRKA